MNTTIGIRFVKKNDSRKMWVEAGDVLIVYAGADEFVTDNEVGLPWSYVHDRGVDFWCKNISQNGWIEIFRNPKVNIT